MTANCDLDTVILNHAYVRMKSPKTRDFIAWKWKKVGEEE